jgi:Tol biopolymer transport system component
MAHRPTIAAAVALSAALAAPAAATPPGRNGLIVWQRESPNAPPHLYVANADGSDARSVFASRAEFEGAFSPTDPNVVVFTRGGRRPFSEDLFSGNLQTGAVTRIRRAGSADLAPALSPDGRNIAYFAFPRVRNLDEEGPPPPTSIHLVGLDGSGHRVITPRRRRGFDPDWSPDGSRIVYAETRIRGEAALNRLAIMNADGSGRRPLTAFGGVDEVNPKWMPDGRTIVFEQLRRRRTRSDIASIGVDGGPVRSILSTPAWETNPIPSPDGTRILFTSDRDRRGRDRLGPGTELYTMAVDGSDVVRLTNNRRPDIFPDWQRLP